MKKKEQGYKQQRKKEENKMIFYRQITRSTIKGAQYYDEVGKTKTRNRSKKFLIIFTPFTIYSIFIYIYQKYSRKKLFSFFVLFFFQKS